MLSGLRNSNTKNTNENAKYIDDTMMENLHKHFGTYCGPY